MPGKKNNGYNLCKINSQEGLTEAQKHAAELLQSGEFTKMQIAEMIGIHRNTLLQWERKDKFVAYMRKLSEEKTRQTKALIADISTDAAKIMRELMKSKDKRVQFEVAKYILDRNLGKPTAKLNVDETINGNEDYDLSAALQRISREFNSGDGVDTSNDSGEADKAEKEQAES